MEVVHQRPHSSPHKSRGYRSPRLRGDACVHTAAFVSAHHYKITTTAHMQSCTKNTCHASEHSRYLRRDSHAGVTPNSTCQASTQNSWAVGKHTAHGSARTIGCREAHGAPAGAIWSPIGDVGMAAQVALSWRASFLHAAVVVPAGVGAGAGAIKCGV